jgi:hypothetical protein
LPSRRSNGLNVWIDTFGGTLDLEVSAAEKTLADKVVEIDWDGIGG